MAGSQGEICKFRVHHDSFLWTARQVNAGCSLGQQQFLKQCSVPCTVHSINLQVIFTELTLWAICIFQIFNWARNGTYGNQNLNLRPIYNRYCCSKNCTRIIRKCFSKDILLLYYIIIEKWNWMLRCRWWGSPKVFLNSQQERSHFRGCAHGVL